MYLFAAPSEFAVSYENQARDLRRLEEIVARYKNPELINGGKATAPSKRILGIFPTYKKTVDGLRIAEKIGIPRIREKCPHFDQWLSKLESLGSTDAPAR